MGGASTGFHDRKGSFQEFARDGEVAEGQVDQPLVVQTACHLRIVLAVGSFEDLFGSSVLLQCFLVAPELRKAVGQVVQALRQIRMVRSERLANHDRFPQVDQAPLSFTVLVVESADPLQALGERRIHGVECLAADFERSRRKGRGLDTTRIEIDDQRLTMKAGGDGGVPRAVQANT